jgi:hypothetical protein
MNTLDSFLAKSGQELAKVFRDGTKLKFGYPSGVSEIIGREKGFPAFVVGYKVYPAFEINGLINPNEILNPLYDFPYASGARYIDDTHQLFLQCASSNKLGVHSLETGAKLYEITHNAGEYFHSIAWVQYGQVVGMCKENGKVIIMDYLSSAPQVVATGRVDPFIVGAYDCSFKLFFTIGSDYKTRVYTGDLYPAGLSNPVISPVSVSGLNSNEVKVRLTGQDSEPMPNWWVNWSLVDVGDGLIGRLDKYGSVTDSDGYATTLYIGPDDATTGQCKVKASVVL